MYFKTLPKKGDKIEMCICGSKDGKETVLDVYPYTGVYKEHFTHVVRYTALRTRRGWMEIAVDVESERNKI